MNWSSQAPTTVDSLPTIAAIIVPRRNIARVVDLCPTCVTEDQREVVLAAALLHDIGHGPFSHAFEKITGDKHETRTLEIITSEDTEVNKVLRRVDPSLPDRLKVFFDEDLDERDRGEAEIPAFLAQIVSSQLDADRFDYLLRDSYSTGAEYGQFDIEWMLQHLGVDDERGRFFLGRKALFAGETYVFARYHMYRSVYYHKTTRAAEVMLRLLFRRFKERLTTESDSRGQMGIVPGAPPTVCGSFAGGIPLNEYLLLDDHSLTEFAKACTSSSDGVLSELAAGLLHRRLFKATDVTDELSPRVAEFSEKAKEIIRAAGLEAEFAFAHDAPSDTPYKLYNPDAEKPATQIYVETSSGKHRELSQESDSVRQLTKEYTLVRYYFPASVREGIRAEAEPLLFRE